MVLEYKYNMGVRGIKMQKPPSRARGPPTIPMMQILLESTSNPTIEVRAPLLNSKSILKKIVSMRGHSLRDTASVNAFPPHTKKPEIKSQAFKKHQPMKSNCSCQLGPGLGLMNRTIPKIFLTVNFC